MHYVMMSIRGPRGMVLGWSTVAQPPVAVPGGGGAGLALRLPTALQEMASRQLLGAQEPGHSAFPSIFGARPGARLPD